MNALINDDEDLARAVVREHLAAHPDVDVAAECSNGFEALKAVAQHQPDLIFLDIQMPKLDGFGFIERVRENEAYRGTPILVLTTESDPEKKDRARRAGATGWIVKPFNPDKLIDAIRRVAA